jgi:RHS repeat-associated protein
MIPTGTAINACAANWVTGQTVCTDNNQGVYIIEGGQLTTTRGDNANGTQGFSGGGCQTCGVVVDANTNLAILSIGQTIGLSSDVGAFQIYDITANTFTSPVSLGLNPNSSFGYTTSEQPAIDPIRKYLLSPDEFGNFQIVKYGGTPAVFDNTQFPREADENKRMDFDSAAVDCTTGIALAVSEDGPSATGELTLVDTSQAVFTPGTPKGTWSAPSNTIELGNLPWIAGQYPDRALVTLAVAPGTHLGLLAEEFGGGTLIALSLPSAAGQGPPNLVDWAVGTIVQDPTGTPWASFADPHGITGYTSPRTGRAMAVVSNSTFNYQLQPTFLARIDLQALLDAPRLAGSHNIDPSYSLVANGVVTFIEMPCAGVDLSTDPNNCGTCGAVCPVGVNAKAICTFDRCSVQCNAGFANCGGGAALDACPVDLTSDPLNCGACGTSCAEPNATGVCTNKQCGFVCNPGFNACQLNDGCETHGQCPPPVVTATGPTNVTAGDTVTYTATATGAQTRTLSYAWSIASGPATAVLGSPGGLTTTALFNSPGTYVLKFAASDGFSTSTASVSVNVTLVNQPPVIAVGANQVLTPPTNSTTLTATVTDDGKPAGASLTATWTVVSGPVAVAIATPSHSAPEPGPLGASTTVTFAYPGTYVFQLAASDTLLSASATTTVTVNAPAAITAGAPPTVAIGGVTDDQEITAPAKILATVSDGSWVLERRLGGRDDVQTAWSVLASGTGPKNGVAIATFDPTLLLNGIYTLRLSSTNSAGSARTSVSLSVNARMKVGNFTLAFTDLDVNVGGLPLTLTRTYDSRDKTVGDFGVGWKLGIRDVRVEKSGKSGAYWSSQFIDLGSGFDEFCLTPLQSASVAITFPNGRQYRFTPQSSPPCQLENPITTPDIGWVSTSDPDNPAITLAAAEETSVFTLDVGGGVTQLLDSQGNIWDPRRFTLATEDGSLWLVDQDLGVTELDDRNGNIIQIGPNGILHSSGAQITFDRDTEGRITSVTDPSGASMAYAYDANSDLVSHADRLAHVTQFSYSTNHYLDTIQDPLGRQPIRNQYDSDGRLVSTTDAAGNTVQYAANIAANQEQVADRLGHVTLYTYNDRGDVTQKVDATGAVWKYTYDTRGNPLTATDPLGRTITKTFDGADNLLTTTDALGNVTTNTYNAFREVLTSIDPLGRLTTNAYDAAGNLLTTTDPLGNATRYTYDGIGNRLTETDALNNLTLYIYDGAGHIAQTIDPLGHTTNCAYDANGRKTSEKGRRSDANGSSAVIATGYTYDALGHLIQTAMGHNSPGDGPVRSTTYTATGRRATDTDPVGRVTHYTYDALDRLVSTTRPDGTTTSQAYDAENHRVSSTDAAGNVTRYVYDPVGRLIRTTFADGSSTSTTYDAAGQPIQTVDELGHVRWSSYDAAGHLATTTDPLGGIMLYAYDAAGNQTSSIDALNRQTLFTYDADNRLLATTYADGSVDAVQYDAVGHVLGKTDVLNRSTAYVYDADGRLVRVTDAAGHTTLYAVDEAGLTVAMQDANGRGTVLSYDSFTNVRTTRQLPDGSTEIFGDDAAGQIVKRTDFNGMTTSYAYDPMGRVRSRTYPDGSVVSFTYTPSGRRATTTDRRGTTSYTYDSRNRLVLLTEADGRQLAYGYDAHGDRTTLTAQIGGTSLTTTTSYDANHRPTAVVDPLGRTFSFAYDAAGNRVSANYPNGAGANYSYDARDRLTALATTVDAAPVASFAYVLDAVGRRAQVTEADGTVRQYGYDSLDRLTAEQVTGALSYAKTFSYDSVGNRLTQTGAGAAAGADGGTATVSYAYDTRDRLLTENATTYTYDANGNIIAKSGEASYQWDFDSRLAQATMAGSNVVVSHGYDADGNRTQTSVTPPSTGSVACKGNSAAFVRQDYATQGNWQGTYGADGYYINAVTPAPPAYGSVSFTNTNNFTWASSTSDVRALQQPAPLTSRIASTYYSTTSETLHVATTDGNEHVVAFYLLDWDASRRAESVTAQTPTGTVLDAARPFGSFSRGVWAVYTICGSVDFVFTLTGAVNAVVSGVFFGPPPGAATTTNLLVDPAGCPSCGGSGLSQVIADTDGNGNLTAYYVRVGDELIEVMRPGASPGTWTTRFVHHDGLGSVRALTDETGITTDTRGYEAFGTKNVEAGGDALAYGFAGEPLQTLSMLAYHRARWMDSRVGRFLGMDPLPGTPLVPGSLHRYAYASSNPPNAVDPTGLDDLIDVSAASAGAGILATLAPPSLAAVAASIEGGVVAGEAIGVVGAAAESAALPAELAVAEQAATQAIAAGAASGDVSIGVLALGALLVNGSAADYIKYRKNAKYRTSYGIVIEEAANDNGGGDDDDPCYQQYLTEVLTCRNIGRLRGDDYAVRCYATAIERLAACREGKPIPPLDTYNN